MSCLGGSPGGRTGAPVYGCISWWRGCPRRWKVVALSSHLGSWQGWSECWDLNFSTWTLTIPLSTPSSWMWWLTSKAVKMEAQDLISSKDLLLWNKPSPNNSTNYLIDLSMILQSGPFSSAPHGTSWCSSTTATGLRVEVWLTGLTPQPGWLNCRRLPGFLSLHSLSHHSVI